MLCVTEGFVNYIRTVWSHLLHMLTVTTHIHMPHDLAQHWPILGQMDRRANGHHAVS